MDEIDRSDLPVCAISDPEVPETPFVIVDVKGQVRARYATMEEAQKIVGEINLRACELMQPDIHDTGTEPVPEQVKPKPKSKSKAKAKAKSRAKPKGKAMPRGIPKKKRASKKSAAKKAAVVKKAPKKTMKRKKRKA